MQAQGFKGENTFPNKFSSNKCISSLILSKARARTSILSLSKHRDNLTSSNNPNNHHNSVLLFPPHGVRHVVVSRLLRTTCNVAGKAR
jgi:hypothetical protein